MFSLASFAKSAPLTPGARRDGLGLRLGGGLGVRVPRRLHGHEDVRRVHLLGHRHLVLPLLVLGGDVGVGGLDLRPDLGLVDQEVLHPALHRRAIAILVLVQELLEVRIGGLGVALDPARRDEHVLDRGPVVLLGVLAQDLRFRDDDRSLHQVAVLLQEHLLPHLFLEDLGIEAVGAQRALVGLAAHELAVVLEEGQRHDLLGELGVGDRQVETARGLEPQLPLDHRVEDVARQIEGPFELGREIALVHLLVALELRLVLAVELDGRDPLAADARDDLAGRISVGARTGPEDEAEDEDGDHGEERPLQVVEAVAHRLEHRKPLSPESKERATIYRRCTLLFGSAPSAHRPAARPDAGSTAGLTLRFRAPLPRREAPPCPCLFPRSGDSSRRERMLPRGEYRTVGARRGERTAEKPASVL